MSEHAAEIVWTLSGEFETGAYSRAHEIRLDGGLTVPGSASPSVVPPPGSDPAALDPEEAFVAALSACHMLWFLDHARRAGHLVSAYRDRASGRLATDADGRAWIAKVTLAPRVTWGSALPAPTEVERLHHLAHEACFIANSVRTEVVVIPA